MKSNLLTITALGVACCYCLAQDKPADSSALKGEKARFSYALGMNYGASFTNLLVRQEVEPDLDYFLKGIKDVVYTNQTLLAEAEARQILADTQQKLAAKREEKRKQLAAENQKKANAFLAENKTKPGVITTETGLQYKVLTEGTGSIPTAGDTVTTHYKGALLDGTEFDNSYKRGQPYSFPVAGGVIPGWTEALTKMKVGSKWQLFIPPNLAYGEAGRPSIPPNSLLTFEVELISNAPPAPPPPTPTPSAAPLTSDIIKVPSLEEMKAGAKIETIKAEDVEKEIQKQKAEKKQ